MVKNDAENSHREKKSLEMEIEKKEQPLAIKLIKGAFNWKELLAGNNGGIALALVGQPLGKMNLLSFIHVL